MSNMLWVLEIKCEFYSMNWCVVLLNWSQCEWKVVMGGPASWIVALMSCWVRWVRYLAQVRESRVNNLSGSLLPIIQISCLMCAEWVFSVPPRNISMWDCRMISDEFTTQLWCSWMLSDIPVEFVKLTFYLDDSFWFYTCSQIIERMILWDLRIFRLLSSGWKWTRGVRWSRRILLCWLDQLWVSSLLNFAVCLEIFTFTFTLQILLCWFDQLWVSSLLNFAVCLEMFTS